ncbi:MAG: VOC family protein [Chlorobia bacterium]|nr:VOC family protein [Fimbriimonadaceae bacterium]
MKIITYISFAGNAREAMNFYKGCLGGELTIMEVGGSPIEEHLTSMKKDDILHSQLDSGNLSLMGSDMCGPNGITKGNNVTLMLLCESEELLHKNYASLVDGGTRVMPVGPAFWGGLYGHLVDRFGIEWGLHWSEEIQTKA